MNVYETKNMTDSAQKLHLTQSGISQHIKSLEKSIDQPLFDRIKNRLVPTSQGHDLYKSCQKAFHHIEKTLTQIRGISSILSGHVKIGMPSEFGNSFVIPLLSEFSLSHPHIRFEIHLGTANEMAHALLKGDLDFAFIDEISVDKRIFIQKIFNETLSLCAHKDYLATKGPIQSHKEYFENLEYLDYQIGEPILKLWFQQSLGLRSILLKTKVHVMEVQAVAKMILLKMGAGVLPEHLAHKLISEGQDLHIFNGSGKTKVKNTISLAYLNEKSWPPAAEHLKDFFISKLPGREKPLMH